MPCKTTQRVRSSLQDSHDQCSSTNEPFYFQLTGKQRCILFLNKTQTPVMKTVNFNFALLYKLDVSYASMHTFLKVI